MLGKLCLNKECIAELIKMKKYAANQNRISKYGRRDKNNWKREEIKKF